MCCVSDTICHIIADRKNKNKNKNSDETKNDPTKLKGHQCKENDKGWFGSCNKNDKLNAINRISHPLP